MSNNDQRLTPRATSKWLLFFVCKMVALAYAISLIPLPVKMAHVVAVEGFVLWLLLSTIYTVWYRRRRNVPEGEQMQADLRRSTGPSFLRRDRAMRLNVWTVRHHDVRVLGSGKQPPCLN